MLRGALMGYSRDLDADCARPPGEPRRGPAQQGVWRVCSGLLAAGGGVAKATQFPLGVKVLRPSRADLSPSFRTCCGSVIGLRVETARAAGLKPILCEASREAGRRLAERPPAVDRPGSHSELRGRGVPAARRRWELLWTIASWGLGAAPRVDRAITRRRGRRPRAWGEARGPRASRSRPLRSRARAAA